MNEPFETPDAAAHGITNGCLLACAIWGALALVAVIVCAYSQVCQ